jgi:signal transduction histidine kinase
VRAAASSSSSAYHVAANVPDRLIGDAGRIRQVLLNLVGNAIKFTEHGEIVVDVGLHENGTESKRRARGARRHVPAHPSARYRHRHPADQLSASSGPSSRSDGSTARRYGGTGLGLSISARLAELMGRPAVAGQPFGEGSTFHFTARSRLHGDGRGAADPSLAGAPC